MAGGWYFMMAALRRARERENMDRNEYDWRQRAAFDSGICPSDGTPRGLSHAVLHAVPWARAAECETIGPGLAVMRVRLPAWTWLALGVLHFFAYKLTRTVVERDKPAGAKVLISVWG